MAEGLGKYIELLSFILLWTSLSVTIYWLDPPEVGYVYKVIEAIQNIPRVY